MRESTGTHPFAPFEWMLALRYLRAKRAESFISVISMISLVGIALGVATLIIVMAVMNGFRHELLSRILGLNGHERTAEGGHARVGHEKQKDKAQRQCGAEKPHADMLRRHAQASP